ncbi:MAG TPA: TetR/AcrR family transcriptional regulator, partial [Miltoncostaeaceae bacterium]|nr:TetR/AcrR family transcriptional regulator [Miltoncostaeaceae bacterium]
MTDPCGGARRDPRLERSRAAVLAATVEILCDDGLPAVTVEAVAARAGVAKTTVYRQWDGRAHLVVDALRSTACTVAPPDSGAVREDLIGLLAGLAHALDTAPWARALAGVAESARHDPALASLHRTFAADCRGPVLEVLTRARSRGEVRPDADLTIAASALAGPLFYRRLVSLEPLDAPGLVEAIVDTVLPGLAPRAAPAAPAAGAERSSIPLGAAGEDAHLAAGRAERVHPTGDRP